MFKVDPQFWQYPIMAESPMEKKKIYPDIELKQSKTEGVEQTMLKTAHYQSLVCEAPSDHVEEAFNSVSCRERLHTRGQADCTPIYSLFILLLPQAAYECWRPIFCYCVKASVPQPRGKIKPLAQIDGVTVTCPFRLWNGIFHFEEGSGNTREANTLNRSLFFWKSFMVIAADRILYSGEVSGRAGNHLRAD